jgi:outer membrane protein assembly factor BamA
MVNGISVNGLGEVAMDVSQTASNLIGLGKQLSHDLILGRNSTLSILYTEMAAVNILR